MTSHRPIILSLVLAATTLAPAAALAKHGADDPAGDDRVGQSATSDDSRSGGARDDDAKATRAKQVVRVAGECTGSSTTKLKVKRDRGRLQAELEVDQNIA